LWSLIHALTRLVVSERHGTCSLRQETQVPVDRKRLWQQDV